MTNASLNLVNLDFDANKAALKAYLQGQTKFQDYDFDGSNMNVLLDILSYNTNQNAFYLNMVGSEMFMDSAQLRSSVVSHAKELNYLPRSFTSASASIDITIDTGNTAITTLTVPKGTSFTTRIDSNTYTFTTAENQILIGNSGVFSGTSNIYEGTYTTDSYVYNSSNTAQKFIISNENVDIDSLTVSVIEDSGATVLTYTKAETLYNLTADSKVFFVQMTIGEKYEVVFGDGVIGRQPKDNSTIVLEARISHGELPNGAFKFTADGPISGYSNVVVSTVSAAYGGAVGETIESIRYNAPRAFTTQERAITTEDYENLLRAEFPDINAVSAYGGEEATPPQYGKVFISVDLQNFDGLPSSREAVFKSFIKKRSPLSIDPVFIAPEYLYVNVDSTVRYNVNLTNLSAMDIELLAVSAISEYSSTNLNDFKSTLRYSQLVKAIDDSHTSIISNDTKISALKKVVPVTGVPTNYTVDYGFALDSTYPYSLSSNDNLNLAVFKSNLFKINDRVMVIEAGTDGIIWLSSVSGGVRSKIKKIGSINLTTGIAEIQSLQVDSISSGGSTINFSAIPATRDLSSSKNMILAISESDINISVEAIRE